MLKIKSIKPVHEVDDLENDFLDVIVKDITGYGYTVTVATPNNSMNFYKPEPLIIVKKLTQQFSGRTS